MAMGNGGSNGGIGNVIYGMLVITNRVITTNIRVIGSDVARYIWKNSVTIVGDQGIFTRIKIVSKE
jgi:hypothetical protein